MSRNPFGWDLPPGVSHNDPHFQDEQMKECPDCEGDGCVMDDGAPDAKPVTCKTCDGEGEITMTEDDHFDLACEKADRQMDEQKDRDMGL